MKTITINCPLVEHLSIIIRDSDLIEFKNLVKNCLRIKELVISITDYEYKNYEERDCGQKILNILIELAHPSINKIILYKGWKFSFSSLKFFFNSLKFLSKWKGQPKVYILICHYHSEEVVII